MIKSMQSPFSEQRCLEEVFSFLHAWEAQNCPGFCRMLVEERLKPVCFITQLVVQLTGLLGVFCAGQSCAGIKNFLFILTLVFLF